MSNSKGAAALASWSKCQIEFQIRPREAVFLFLARFENVRYWHLADNPFAHRVCPLLGVKWNRVCPLLGVKQTLVGSGAEWVGR